MNGTIPKISVITICFNNGSDIRPTIESVIHQRYTNIEYIIIDGGSTDNTLQIINEYKDKISKVVSEPDKGLYDAINKGIKNATGDIVGLIHAGDRLYDDSVLQKIAYAFSKNNVDIIYGHSKIINKRKKVIRINKSPDYKPSLVRRGWMPSHQSIYVKRELFDRWGYYNTDLYPISDYEWFIRFFYINRPRIRRINEYLVKFYTGGVSTTNYMGRLTKESKMRVENCWLSNGLKPPAGITYFKLMRKIPQFLLAWID